jgi:drug/metabolite transporter (DMT)-like permease
VGRATGGFKAAAQLFARRGLRLAATAARVAGMSPTVFAIVLATAALHAGWNAVVKGSSDKTASAVAICVAASLMAAAVLPFVAQPARASWPFIAGSVGLQTVYYMLVAAAYHRTDMSQAYPIMRGGAPLIVAALAGLAFGESLPPLGWAGVALISGGIASIALLARGGSGAGVAFALANALVIASYTLCDGFGVRRSGAPVGYTLWIFLATAAPVTAWAFWRRGRVLAGQLARRWRDGIVGGLGTMISYGAALWAMTLAPVAMVAALRETSILFATAISALVLRERVGPARIMAVALIALGAAALRLA